MTNSQIKTADMYIMKTIGNLNTTDGRQTTERLAGEWSSKMESQKGYYILSEYLDENELTEQDRWFDIEEDEEGRKFATSGTVDLEYYIEVE